MSNTINYYKTILNTEDMDVEYSSETDEVTVTFRHRIVKGDVIYTEHMSFHPSYVEPLTKLLKEVMEVK